MADEAGSATEEGQAAAPRSPGRPTRLMVLGGAAVLAIYAAGWSHTEPAAAKLFAQPAPQFGGSAAGAGSSPASGTVDVPPPATVSPTPPASSAPPRAPGFAGRSGARRHGFGEGFGDRPGGYGRRFRRFEGGGAVNPRRSAGTPPPSPSANPPASANPRASTNPPASPNPPASGGVPAPGGAAASHATAVRYRDGTYTATGVGRHGPISVRVKVSGGRIVSATITSCGTRFPCSWIAALPREVIASQSVQVDAVAGASASSQAFLDGVAQALAQAR